MSQKNIILSIVIPVYNEADMIKPLYARLDSVLCQVPETSEIIFIDDGSSDDSWMHLLQLPQGEAEFQFIKLSRNFGKEAAMSAGLEYSRGKAVILLDADLQDPPELIPEMLNQWRDGHDLVNMKRRNRYGETWFKRFSAKYFYRLMNWISTTPVPTDVGDFRLLSRQIVDTINTMPERNRFMKGLFSWPGFSQVTLEFDRDPRSLGQSKWNYNKLFSLAMDGITSFSFKPLRLATYGGVMTLIAALIMATTLVVKNLFFEAPFVGINAVMLVQLILAGIQLLALGLIGEYLGRMFMEIKQRPLYLVEKIDRRQAQSNDKQDNNIRYL